MWLLIHAGIKVKPFNKRGLVPCTASQSADAVLLQFCICSIVSCAVSVRGVRGFGRYVIEWFKIFFMQMDYKFMKNLVYCIHDDLLTCTGNAKAAIKKALWQRKSWLGFVASVCAHKMQMNRTLALCQNGSFPPPVPAFTQFFPLISETRGWRGGTGVSIQGGGLTRVVFMGYLIISFWWNIEKFCLSFWKPDFSDWPQIGYRSFCILSKITSYVW